MAEYPDTRRSRWNSRDWGEQPGLVRVLPGHEIGSYYLGTPNKSQRTFVAHTGPKSFSSEYIFQASFVSYRKMHLHANSLGQWTLNEPTRNSAEMEIQAENLVIVLRCPRSTWQPLVLQNFTALFSCGFYTYGTVVLASITWFEAADAVRVAVVLPSMLALGEWWNIGQFRHLVKGKESDLS